MIFIVLRNGKVLQYNNVERCTASNGCLNLADRDGKFMIAKVPIDIVERAEWSRPCRILKAKRPREIKRKYD